MNIISELEKYLDRANTAKSDGQRLAAIMTDMEHRYEIPTLSKSLPEWESKTPDAARILKTYRYIAGLRDL